MNEMIPFGKYRGKPVEAMAEDHEYVQWLVGQDWFRSKYPTMFNVVINNFTEPQETPAHNKIQAMFLDAEVCNRLVALILKTARGPSEGGKNWKVDSISEIEFESGGIDVRFRSIFWTLEDACELVKDPDHYGYMIKVATGEKKLIKDQRQFAVEIKPSIGDDYPIVLRQMLRINDYLGRQKRVLVYDDFQASGVTESQMGQIFKTQGIFCARLNDFCF